MDAQHQTDATETGNSGTGTVEHWARVKPEAIAIVDDVGNSLTWDSWNRQANALATALRDRGLEKGDIVVVSTRQRLEWSIINLALGKLGCLLLGTNPKLTPSEVKFILNDSKAAAVICDDQHPAALVSAFEGQSLKARISLDAEAPGFEMYASLIDNPAAAAIESEADTQRVLYTSGTTGLPRGVVRSKRTDPEARTYLADVYGGRHINENDVVLVTMPVHHGAGPGQMSTARKRGCKLVILPKYDPLEVLRLIAEHKVTRWTAVPTMFKRLAALPEGTVEKYDCSSLRSLGVGAAPASKELKAWITLHFGNILSEGYGSTEIGLITRMPADLVASKPGSCGVPYKNVKIEIRNEVGEVLPAGEVGEIWVYTPNSISSYLNEPPLSKDVRDERGFFRTGDMGHLDADGFLYISDRVKDMIIRGGVNIYPAEVEAALLHHDAVAEAAVIGIPDDEFGESVMAFCELKPGRSASADEILAVCAKSLAPHKRPKRLDIVAELPRSTIGKMLKRELRAPFWAGREKQI